MSPGLCACCGQAGATPSQQRGNERAALAAGSLGQAPKANSAERDVVAGEADVYDPYLPLDPYTPGPYLKAPFRRMRRRKDCWLGIRPAKPDTMGCVLRVHHLGLAWPELSYALPVSPPAARHCSSAAPKRMGWHAGSLGSVQLQPVRRSRRLAQFMAWPR